MNSGSFTRLALALLFFSIVLSSGNAADSPDDRYVEIYSNVMAADGLNAEGKRDEALKQYTRAHNALLELKRSNPAWNPKVVAFRLNELSAKIAALTQPEVAPGSAAPTEASPTRSGRDGGTLKLLAAGAEPRTVLRFHPKSGDVQTAVLTMKITTENQMAGVPGQAVKTPPVQMTVEMTIKNVAENGDISFETVMKDITTVDEPGVAPEMAELVRKSLEGIKDFTVSGVVSSRGIQKSHAAKTAAKTDPFSQQTLGQMQELMGNMVTELPEEAVGVGARWETRKQLRSQGIMLSQVTSKEVVSIDNDRVVLSGTITQTAANQKIQNPSLSVKLDLTKMTSNGTDATTLDLNRLMPVAATGKVSSEAVMSMSMGGNKQAVTSKTEMELELKQK